MFRNGQNSDAATGRLLAAALGLASGVAAFAVSVTLVQTLTGGRIAPILLPLVVCGAVALALLVGTTASSEAADALGAARARRALVALAPLATLVAFVAYSTDPATVQRPLASASPTSVPNVVRPIDPNAPILLPGFEAAPPAPGTPLVRRPGTRTGGRPVARAVRRGGGLVVAPGRPAAPERPFIGPVAVPVDPPVAPPVVAVPDAPEPRVVTPRGPGIAPRIVEPSGGNPVTKAGKSRQKSSRACPGRRRGWERSPRKPPPHTCTKK